MAQLAKECDTADSAGKVELLEKSWTPIGQMASEVFDILAGWLSPDGCTVTHYSLKFFDKGQVAAPLFHKMQQSGKEVVTKDKEAQISKEDWMSCVRGVHDDGGMAGRMSMHTLLTKLLRSFIREKHSAEKMAKKVARSLDTSHDHTVQAEEVKMLVSRLEIKEASEVEDTHPLVIAFAGIDTKVMSHVTN